MPRLPEKSAKITLNACGDCAAEAGQPHDAGCDVECCSVCGGQRIQCDETECADHDPAFARWTGFWPGFLEAQALGIDPNELHRQCLTDKLFIKPGSKRVRSTVKCVVVKNGFTGWCESHLRLTNGGAKKCDRSPLAEESENAGANQIPTGR